MDITGIILTALVSLVFGLIGGAGYSAYKIFMADRKAKKEYKKSQNVEYKESKIFQIKDNPDQIIEEHIPNSPHKLGSMDNEPQGVTGQGTLQGNHDAVRLQNPEKVEDIKKSKNKFFNLFKKNA